ncbi:MAG TPA: hypothetical protein EYP81_02080 [Thermodesulfobacteriaceae bacterium]|nr:hypothetical protein [Thermodesulfobacteriaceae bacterium]
MEVSARRPLSTEEKARLRELLLRRKEEICRTAPESEILQEIEEALQRLEAGHYGRCIDCGRWIRLKRLETIPWAKRCRACQEKWDMLEAVE